MRNFIFLTLSFFAFLTGVNAQGNVQCIDLDIFTDPKPEYKQMVIYLPHSSLDQSKQVQLIIGKQMQVDTCNSYSLLGNLQQNNLQGWGV